MSGKTAEPVSVGAQLAAALDERDSLKAAMVALFADRNELREALRRIALGQDRDPSVAADKALVASRDRREQWEPVIELQPSPELTEAQVTELRERFDAAITGAGTEHVARQLLDPDDPHSPAWQKLTDRR